MRHHVRVTLGLLLASLALPAALRAQGAKPPMTAEQQAELIKLQKLSQNPVGNLMSFPMQLNTSYGGTGGTQNTLNFQPVLPFQLDKKWNLITRAIFPLVWQPAAGTNNAYYSGLGSTSFTAFLSPADPGKVIWGGGLVLNFPSTSPQLAPAGGSRKWSAGPSVVVLTMPGQWVVGALASQTWSYAGPGDAPYWSVFYSQIFLNYNLKKGWYLTMAPIITANWTASSSDVWTVPIGAGVGRLVKLGGKLPININLSAYGYAVKPTGGPDWTLRTQMALLLPKG